MATVGDTVQYVSYILNDQEPGHEYVVWPKPLLEASFKEAVQALTARVPWLFKKSTTLDLSPGAAQALPSSMVNQFSVIGQQCTKNGIPFILSGATRVEEVGEAGCCEEPADGMFAKKTGTDDGCGGYNLNHWSLDPSDPTTFFVEPPVPAGKTPKVKVSYVDVPDTSSTASTDAFQIALPLVVDWMLHRAYSTDLKTDDVRLRADAHRQQFEVGVNRMMQTYIKGMPTEN